MTSTRQETRMLPHISAAATAARTNHDVTRERVADELRAKTVTVERFEECRAWPKHPDEMIAAYSRATGEPVVAIWQNALARMRASRPAEDRWRGPAILWSNWTGAWTSETTNARPSFN